MRGHAIECRICAEDVMNRFAPSTGRIAHLRPPQGPGVREDRGIEEGSDVSVYYDPMLSKLCVWALTREEAIDRMSRALGEYELLGVSTNLPLLRFVMEHPAFRQGAYSTHFLQQEFTPSALEEGSPEALEDVAAVCALLEDRRLTALAETDHGGAEAGTGGGWRGRNGWRAKRTE